MARTIPDLRPEKKVVDHGYWDSGFERPELGVDQSHRMDDYVRQRRAQQRAKLACRADLFCDGKVIAFGLCGGHLRAAHRAGNLPI